MCQWLWRHILVLACVARKELKLWDLLTMLSVNSSTCTDFSWFMVAGAIVALAGSCATISTRTLCWSSQRFFSLLRMVSQGRSSSLTGCRHCTMRFGHRGLVSSPTHLSKTWMISTCTSILKCIRLARRASTSTLRFSGDGSSFRSGMELHVTLALSM